MNKKIEVINGPFSEEEVYLILKQYPKRKRDLEFYLEANYFQIHKLYYQHFFLGYVVLFLGYNSIETNDVMIEDICFLSNPELLNPLMSYLLKAIKAKSIISFPIDQLYYNQMNVDPIYLPIFESLDIKLDGEPKCRA